MATLPFHLQSGSQSSALAATHQAVPVLDFCTRSAARSVSSYCYRLSDCLIAKLTDSSSNPCDLQIPNCLGRPKRLASHPCGCTSLAPHDVPKGLCWFHRSRLDPSYNRDGWRLLEAAQLLTHSSQLALFHGRGGRALAATDVPTWTMDEMAVDCCQLPFSTQVQDRKGCRLPIKATLASIREDRARTTQV